MARSRRMTRSFEDRAVSSALVDTFIDAARLAPTAGNSATPEFLVLEGSGQVGAYWDATLPRDRRATFAWPGLLVAPVLVLILVQPDAYLRRYREPDKAASGLGESTEAWTTPYWWVDGGMAAMTILLAAEESGLGALFFGVFEHEESVKARFGIPADRRAVGVIALGYRADDGRHGGPGRGGSGRRGRRSLDQVTHRAHWGNN